MTDLSGPSDGVVYVVCMLLMLSVASTVVICEVGSASLVGPETHGQPISNSDQQRVVIAEFFTAVWGSNTQDARRALDLAVDAYGEGRVACVAYHHDVGDPLGIQEGEQRYQSYGVWTIPTVVFDGVDFIHSAGSVNTAYMLYRNEIIRHLAIPSNVSIQMRASITPDGLGTINVNITRGQNLTDTDKVLRCAIIENGISVDSEQYDQVARRMLPSAAGTLLDLRSASSDDVSFSFETDPGWSIPNLRCVVWVQDKNQTLVDMGRPHYTSQVHGGLEVDFEEVPNNPPYLEQGFATPMTAFEGEEVEFRVLCSDPDGTRPWSVRVHVTNEDNELTTILLTEVPSTSNWTEGHWYKWTSVLPIGVYKFNFRAFDGLSYARGDTDWHTGLWIRPRGPPFELRDPMHSPSNGTPETMFRFEIEFDHMLDLEPTRSVVIVDGVALALTPGPSGPSDGWWTYYCETTLPVGDDHWYFFYFEVDGDVVRYPQGNLTLDGPTVSTMDGPPVLSSASVSPEEGTRLDEFTFKVEYLDPDGVFPFLAVLLVDNHTYEMTTIHWMPGNSTTFETTVHLGLGRHEYSFRFSDGTNVIHHPPVGSIEGPSVLNLAPVAVISSPSMLEVMEGEVIHFSAIGSDDPEDDDLTVLWTLEGHGTLSEDWMFSTSLALGDNDVGLTVFDEHGSSSTTTIQIKVLPTAPVVVTGQVMYGSERPVAGELLGLSIEVLHASGGPVDEEVIDLFINDELIETRDMSIAEGGSTILEYQWETVEGEHVVRFELMGLTVRDDLVVHPNSRPTVSIIIDTPEAGRKVGRPISLISSSSDPDGHELTHTWIVDGVLLDANGSSIEHVFYTGGKHSVHLSVVDELGLVNSTTIELGVRDPNGSTDDGIDPMIIALVIAIIVILSVVLIGMRVLGWGRS